MNQKRYGRVGFDISHEFGIGFPGAVCAHHQHRWVGRKAGDRLELVDLEHGRALEDFVRLGQHHQRRKRHQHGVTIALGLGHLRHADATACAALVLHNNALLEVARHGLCHRPPHGIGHATRWKRHHHGDGFGGVSWGLRQGVLAMADQGKAQAQGRLHQGASLHWVSPLGFRQSGFRCGPRRQFLRESHRP